MSTVQKLAIGAVVLATAWGATTLYIGAQAEKQFNATLDKIEQEFPALNIKERKFEQSFFSSKGTVTLQPDLSGLLDEFGLKSAEETSLTLETHIQHGPLTDQGFHLATFRIQPLYTPEQRAQQKALFGDQEPFTAYGQWRFSGVLHGHYSLAPFAVPDAEHENEIKLGGLTIEFGAQEDKLLWLSGSLPSLSIHPFDASGAAAADALFELGSLNLQTNNHYNGPVVGDVVPSEVSLLAEKLTLRGAGENPSLELGKLALQGSLALQNDFADIKETFTFGSITFRDGNNAQEYKELGSLTFQMDMEHLAAEPLDALLKALENMNAVNLDDKQKLELFAANSAPHLIELLTANPVFSFDPIRLATPKGEISLRVRLAAPGLGQQDLINPVGAFDKLQVDITGAAPKAAVVYASALLGQTSEEAAAKELEGWLADAQKENLFSVEGDAIRFSFQVQQGTVTLNGQSSTFIELLQKSQSAQSLMEGDANEDPNEEDDTPIILPPENRGTTGGAVPPQANVG